MKPSRRTFLKSLLACSTSGLWLPSLSAFAGPNSHQGIVVSGIQHAVLFDLKTSNIKAVETGFGAHSFVSYSQDPLNFVGISWGPQAAFVDFRNEKVRPISSGDDRTFYGHGIYNEKDKIVFITCVDHKTGLGHLLGYNPETLKIESDWQVSPGILHECRYLPDGNLMIASGGVVFEHPERYSNVKERREPTAMLILDPKNGKLLHQISIDDPVQSLNHFVLTKKGQILVLSGWFGATSDFVGHIYLGDTLDGPLRRLEWPASATAPHSGEMLSVALNDDHTMAAVTCPISQTVSFVDLVNGRIVGTAKNSSTWVAYDDARHGFLSRGNALQDAIVVFGKDKPEKAVYTGAVSNDPANPDPFLSGAHALPIKIEA